MLSKWDVAYNVRPCAKLDLGARVPEGQTPMRDGEEPALRELVKLLKDDANSLWPLPPKMVIAGDVDATLIRFLRARKCKVPEAFNMMKASILWRRKDNVDMALETSPGPVPLAAIRSGVSSAYVGYDNEGVPVYIERSGMLEMNSVLEKGTTVEELVRLHVVSMEYFTNCLCMEASIAKGQTVDKVVTIMDLKGVTLANARNPDFSRLFKAMTAIDQDNYPEIMKTVYIVNAPWIFQSIFGLIKGFLDPATQKKIQVLKTKQMTDLIAPVMDLSVIPKCVGGTASDDVLSQPDGHCSAAHHKQDFFIDSFGVAMEELRDNIVGPNCFSHLLNEGVKLYKLCHKSDLPVTPETLVGPPSRQIVPPEARAFISRQPSLESSRAASRQVSLDLGVVANGDSIHSVLMTTNQLCAPSLDDVLFEDMDEEVAEALVTIDRALARVLDLRRKNQEKARLAEPILAAMPAMPSSSADKIDDPHARQSWEDQRPHLPDIMEIDERRRTSETDNDHVKPGRLFCFCFGSSK